MASWPHAASVADKVMSRRAMVASDNAAASDVGSEILARGGNAADAAVATAFALAVTYPTAGNIGGGGFAVMRINGELRALDFRETAPGAASRDMCIDASGKTKPDCRDGIRSVGVPGSVAGLWEIYEKLGSKRFSWAQLMAPAIALAESGFVVDEAFEATLEFGGSRLQKHAASRALFFPDGKPRPRGSRFQNPRLAEVLRRIASVGPSDFYDGQTARAIVDQMRDDGGLITLDDLKRYRAKWRDPIVFQYRGHTLASMPPPSSGGVTLAMMAHILERYNLSAMGYHSPDHVHVLVEAMRRAYAARNAKLGDPDFVSMPIAELLSDAWARAQSDTIKPDKATPSSELTSAAPSASGPHTTHFSVADEFGNAVALTTTINYFYGSGITVKDGGFLLNNEMDDFAAIPGTANGSGLVQSEANAIAPNKRMLSSMAPTIVMDASGTIRLVVGAAGGPTITTTVFQQISNVVDYNFDIAAAVAAPRFHMQHLPDEIVFERGGLGDATRERLTAMGYAFRERGHLADGPAIGRDGAFWIGAPEPRRKGSRAAAPSP